MPMELENVGGNLRTGGWTCTSNSPGDTWHGRNVHSHSSGELHWKFPDSSTEERFLSVLKNNILDTRGTELLLQEISLSSVELRWHFPDSTTEDRLLSVLKNNVSHTRGTELLLQEISLGF